MLCFYRSLNFPMLNCMKRRRDTLLDNDVAGNYPKSIRSGMLHTFSLDNRDR